MAITIDRTQRDAFFGAARLSMGGIGDVDLAWQKGDLDETQRYRRRFEDDMRLLDDLGWEKRADRDEFALTMPPERLERTLRRMMKGASEALACLAAQIGSGPIHSARGTEPWADYVERLVETRREVDEEWAVAVAAAKVLADLEAAA